MNTKRILFAAALTAALSVLSFGTALGDLAASMSPGTWAVLNEADDGSGFTFDMLNDVGGHNILQYTEDAKWDPVRKRFMYLGQGHSSNWDSDPSTHSKFICYDDASGRWSMLPDIPTSENNIGHAYDHSAINPATGDFFHRPYSSRTVYKFSAATQSWSTHSTFPSGWTMYIDISCCMGMEFFPERNGLVLSGKGNAHFYDFSGSSWTTEATGLAMTDQYQSFNEYNPVHKVIVFGGGNGSSDIHKMDAQGNITSLKQAPVGVGVTQTVFTCDPVSGKYLVIHKDGAFYEYDVVSDTWRNIPGRANTLFSNIYGTSFATVAAPVSTYGVVMFLAWNFTNSKVLVYKHDAPPVTAEGNIASWGEAGLSVFPNPFKSRVVITIGKKLRVTSYELNIFDITGKQLATRNSQLATSFTWNASGLPAGVYLLKVTAGNRTYSRRLFLQK